MSTRSSWTQIRPSNLRADVRKGLEARISDPLWSLARQWQLGEFDGDDAASPVKIRLEHGALPVNGLASPRSPGQITTPRRDDLIEPMIEAAPAETGPARDRMSGEAGLQLLRMLPAGRRTEALQNLQQEFPLKPAGQMSDPHSERILSHLQRGAFDGFALRDAIADDPSSLDGLTGLKAGPAGTLAKRWLAYVDDRFADQTGDGFWHQDRLEHRARLHARRGSKVNVTLAAEEHMGGALDWHGFDVPRGGTQANKTATTGDKTEWLIPTPIAYSGMPAERFWDFEDGEVFFGGLTLEKTDLAQVILAEFATVYSNDWFMIPVPAETGTLSRITLLEVHDCFGDKTVVPPCATEDTGARPWRFFELTGDPSPGEGVAPWLYVPRAVSGGDHSRPVEAVTFVRDEMANLAWGIERAVESDAGMPLNRDQHWKRHRDNYPDYTGQGEAPEATGQSEEDAAWRYRYLTTAPPHWVPFAPEVARDQATGRLVRSRMGEWDLLGADRERFAGPKGQIMDPTAPMVINEEEILRGGVLVSRRYESARTPDGRLVIWAARTKRPATSEPSSGRETDVIRTKEARK